MSEYEEMMGADFIEHGILGEATRILLAHPEYAEYAGDVKNDSDMMTRKQSEAFDEGAVVKRSHFGIVRRGAGSPIHLESQESAMEKAMTDLFPYESSRSKADSKTTISTVTEGIHSPT